MAYQLRSLSGLLAFDAAARHESLTLAAKELGRTQSAVSQQVKLLEEQTGLTLFVRRPRTIKLTPDGRALAQSVRVAVEELEHCIGGLKNSDDEHVIRITMVHSFAMKWLSPRLARFSKLHPEYDVRFDADDTVVDLEADGYDLAIRFGKKQALKMELEAGYTSYLLRDETYVAVYSPDLSPTGEIKPEDLAQYPLLRWSTANIWGKWLAANDMVIENPDHARTYSHAALMVQGAVAGDGVAVSPISIAHDAIMAGDLKVVPGKSIENKYVHRAVYPDVDPLPAKVAAFRDWLQDEFARMDEETKSYLA